MSGAVGSRVGIFGAAADSSDVLVGAVGPAMGAAPIATDGAGTVSAELGKATYHVHATLLSGIQWLSRWYHSQDASIRSKPAQGGIGKRGAGSSKAEGT